MNYSGLPEGLRDGMRLYLEHGIPPGSFLEAVLCNDLREACGRADHINRHRVIDIVCWLYNEAPRTAWGSRENYDSWRKMRLDEQNDKVEAAG